MPERTASPRAHAPVKVLLVDDQPMVAEAVRRMLVGEPGISFASVQDPAKALAAALADPPTVALLDLVMPDIDGLTLLRYFRAHPKLKDLPLIVLSTKEEPETKAAAFAQGANDYLVKLPDRVELVARLVHHSKGYTRLLERDRAYRELARQLDMAATYVRGLLPAPLEDGPVRARWLFEPSAQLGGDALGYHWLDEDRFAFCLLDVCDHGVGPALLSVSALNVLKSRTLPGVDFADPAQVLEGLNAVFQMQTHNDLYFTIFYGVYDKNTRLLRHASAGHPPPLLFTPSGGLEELRCQNVFIGAMPGVRYKQAERRVDAPASILVFSDGVYEVRMADGTVGGYEDFKARMTSMCRPGDGAPGSPATGAGGAGLVLEDILAQAKTLSADGLLDDDVSMLLLNIS